MSKDELLTRVLSAEEGEREKIANKVKKTQQEVEKLRKLLLAVLTDGRFQTSSRALWQRGEPPLGDTLITCLGSCPSQEVVEFLIGEIDKHQDVLGITDTTGTPWGDFSCARILIEQLPSIPKKVIASIQWNTSDTQLQLYGLVLRELDGEEVAKFRVRRASEECKYEPKKKRLELLLKMLEEQDLDPGYRKAQLEELAKKVGQANVFPYLEVREQMEKEKEPARRASLRKILDELEKRGKDADFWAIVKELGGPVPPQATRQGPEKTPK